MTILGEQTGLVKQYKTPHKIMPIYEYKCDVCNAKREMLLPYSEAGKSQGCDCGQEMRQKFSLASFSIPLTGRDKVLKALNKEGGFDFPGGNKHRKRYEQSFSQGLDLVKPVIGKGF